MKCPKCDYLGFETGDRCRNCGYDFSLMAPPAPQEPDLDLRIQLPPVEERPRITPWMDQLDRMFGEPEPAVAAPVVAPPVAARSAAPVPAQAPAVSDTPDPPPPVAATPRIVPGLTLDDAPIVPPPAFRGEPSLPLFSAASGDDDEPLVKLPASPRPPLAVRKTPDRPRLRALSKPLPDPEPELQFADGGDAPEPEPAPRRRPPDGIRLDGPASAPGPRVMAAVIDHALLFAIDLAVVYFTLRIASLTFGDWRMLSPVPMLAFLVLIKVAYFSAFTAVGGQTIGKMAAGIRVVTDDHAFVQPTRALQRTLAGALSFATLGLAFVPALFDDEKRTIHDRIAHTRVVGNS
jgi:uncharacterized RDD family membrane protein YckC